MSVTGIIDPVYGLTVFQSDTVQCVWDRIRLIRGGVSSPTLNVGQGGTFWVIAAYEYGSQMFKGHMGQLFLDVYDGSNSKIQEHVAMTWSSESNRWEFAMTSDSSSTRTLLVSGVSDHPYDLTKINDSVGPYSLSWGYYSYRWTPQSAQTQLVNASSQIVWQQNPFLSSEMSLQFAAVIVAVLLVSSTSVIVLWVLGNRNRHRKSDTHV